MRLSVRLCASVMLVAAAFVPASHAVAAARLACSQTWTIQPSPHVVAHSTFLSAVAAVSSTDVWAVGDGFRGTTASGLIEHFDGTTWHIVPSAPLPPSLLPSGGSLHGISALGPSDIWAVGTLFPGYGEKTLVEHYDGKAWTVVPSPSPSPRSSQLAAVSALSPDDAWLVGTFINLQDQGNFDTLTEHWDGHSWQVVPSPNFSNDGQNFLDGVAMVSSNDVWAVGNYGISGGGSPLILHWDGSTWTAVPGAPTGPASGLNGAAAVAANDVWAVGDDSDQQFNQRPLAEHWDGTGWTETPTPPVSPPAHFGGVAATSSSAAWAVGFQTNGGNDQTLIDGWNGTQWSVVSSPNVGSNANDLSGVTALSTGQAWAVGDYMDNQGLQQSLIETYW